MSGTSRGGGLTSVVGDSEHLLQQFLEQQLRAGAPAGWLEVNGCLPPG